MPSQLAYARVYDAAQVRLREFAFEYLRLRDLGLPYERPVLQGIDLRVGLERIAKLPAGANQDTITGYLVETYGLLAVGTDPFLRARLPAVPAQGATIRRRVLGFRNRATGYANHLIGTGAILAAAS